LRIAECAYGEWWTLGMNRPLFSNISSLPRRCLDNKLLLCLLLISTTLFTTSYADQLQGCSLDNTLCDDNEICLPDGLFGQCYSENSESTPLIVQRPLTQIQKEILRIQLMRLAQNNLDWPDASSQCVLAYFKLVVVYELEYDTEFCNVRNPSNIWELVQRVQNIISDSDGVLSNEDLETGRREAKNLIESQAIADPDELIPIEEIETAQNSPLLEEIAAQQQSFNNNDDAELGEPAYLVDPESEIAIPVVIVDEMDSSDSETSDDGSFAIGELPSMQSIALSSGPLTVENSKNDTKKDEKKSLKGLVESDMENPSIVAKEDLDAIVDEIMKESDEAEPQKRAASTDDIQYGLNEETEKKLDGYIHDLMNNKDNSVKKQQMDKIMQLIGSLKAIIDQDKQDMSDPEMEEIVPLTSLSNEQQLLLKKDAELYNNADMGLANTVHKIVKGDFQRVEGNRVYLRMSKEEVTEDELAKLIEYLDRKIALPNNMYFDDFKYENGQLSFRIIRFDYLKRNADKRVSSASGVAQAVYKRRKDIQSLSGVQVDETGIGSGEDAVPVERSDRDWFFVPILGICALTIMTLISVLAVHLIKNRRNSNFKNNLPEVIDNLEGKAATAYEDLCRQRMHDVPSGVTIGAPPTKTGSTSSWPDESLYQSCNLDISTGHVILSFLQEHLNNPGKIADQWNSVSGYYNTSSITTIALEPQNIEKNRDRTVLPYDDNVVTISEGYVNASKIHDSDPHQCSYIITQAPMENTIPDYWQLVWEQGVALLVNLCQIDECERYWPDEGTQIYGMFEVNLVSEHIWSEDYVVRSFYLKSLKTGETRTVTQFHYLSWKKNSVPASNKSLLEFKKKVNKSYRGRASPILLHDFNGAGRAGTYCLIDLVSNRIHKGVKEIDIAASLEHLRDQRPFLVANGEQYKMIFSCVAEEVTSMIKAIQH
jgi:protein tyrosine phosphatase